MSTSCRDRLASFCPQAVLLLPRSARRDSSEKPGSDLETFFRDDATLFLVLDLRRNESLHGLEVNEAGSSREDVKRRTKIGLVDQDVEVENEPLEMRRSDAVPRSA